MHYVSLTAVGISVLPVVLGLIGFKTRSAAFRMLWGWLAFGLTVNAALGVSGSQGKKTAMITQLTFPIFAALGLQAIGMLSRSGSVRRWCTLATVGYVLFWGWRFLHDEAASDFSLYTGPVLWIILTMSAAALIRARLADAPPEPLRDPVLITALAILLLYAPSAALEPVSAALYASHKELTLALWVVRSSLHLVAYILLTLVFYWTLPPRSSPGFSSSAA